MCLYIMGKTEFAFFRRHNVMVDMTSFQGQATFTEEDL